MRYIFIVPGVGVSWGYLTCHKSNVIFHLVLVKALAVAQLRSRCLCLKYIPWFKGRKGRSVSGFFISLLQIEVILRNG